MEASSSKVGSPTHTTPSGRCGALTRLVAAFYDADPSLEHKPSPYDEKIEVSVLTLHYFRHNYATLLYNSGVDVLTAHK